MSRSTKQALTGGKRVDSRCCNHGSCWYCRAHRTATRTRQQSAADLSLRDYLRPLRDQTRADNPRADNRA